MMKNEKPKPVNWSLIENEYLEHNDNEDDEIYLIKEAIRNLTPIQRKIYITWLETGTYTEVARLFNASTPTVKAYLGIIKAKIIGYVDKEMSGYSTEE